MTKDEFWHRYHRYQTHDAVAAYRDASLVNEEGVEGATAVRMQCGVLGWCLTLDAAVDALIIMGVLK